MSSYLCKGFRSNIGDKSLLGIAVVDKAFEKRHVLPDTFVPRKIGAHSLCLEAPEKLPVIIRMDGAFEGGAQIVRIRRLELKTSRHSRFDCGVVRINDGFRQSAGAAYNGQRAISQCIELLEPAWFKSRRLADEIRAGLDFLTSNRNAPVQTSRALDEVARLEASPARKTDDFGWTADAKAIVAPRISIPLPFSSTPDTSDRSIFMRSKPNWRSAPILA
ncbi:hypothetical protein AGR6A_pAt60104 [Agrobacterium sp. NCPPB 925]|nr:hypothetical protein AGR6A_pAt60104 [Agrobacterium sp. NCPPB 925]